MLKCKHVTQIQIGNSVIMTFVWIDDKTFQIKISKPVVIYGQEGRKKVQ